MATILKYNYTVCVVLIVLRMCSCIKHSKHLLLSDELSCIMQINADVTDLVRITQMMYHPPRGWGGVSGESRALSLRTPKFSCIKPYG